MPQSPQSQWIDDPEEYRQKLFGLLGDRHPLDVAAMTADTLTEIAKAHTPEQMRHRPFEGKWTPNEILGHVEQTEWVFGFRMRRMLCEDQPRLLELDQDLWVQKLNPNDKEPGELIESFRALRNINLAVWKQMTPSDLERTGQHDARGPESLDTLMRMMAGHDLSHIGQIKRYLYHAPSN